MIFDAETLKSELIICEGYETIYVKTPDGTAYAVNGFEYDSGEVFLLTEKME